MADDVSLVALVKGSERYIFMYQEPSRASLCDVLRRFAADPELSFTAYDAAKVLATMKLQQLGDEEGNGIPFQR